MHLSICFSSLLCIIIIEDLVLIRNYIWRSFKNIIFIVLPLLFPLLTLFHSPFLFILSPVFVALLSIIYSFIFQHFHFGALFFYYFVIFTSRISHLVSLILSLFRTRLAIISYSIIKDV